jgi:hypothetical protein
MKNLPRSSCITCVGSHIAENASNHIDATIDSGSDEMREMEEGRVERHFKQIEQRLSEVIVLSAVKERLVDTMDSSLMNRVCSQSEFKSNKATESASSQPTDFLLEVCEVDLEEVLLALHLSVNCCSAVRDESLELTDLLASEAARREGGDEPEGIVHFILEHGGV